MPEARHSIEEKVEIVPALVPRHIKFLILVLVHSFARSPDLASSLDKSYR